MKTHFQRDLEHLERDILYLGSLVEQATNKAILALIGAPARAGRRADRRR